jgi:hypothetical protein
MRRTILSFIALFALFAAAPSAAAPNPPAPGFDQAGSDPQAIALADQVMERLGSRHNWDQTRYLTWRFFGKRLHLWDKWTGKIRFEEGGLVVLMNINTGEGRAWQEGQAVSEPDTLKARLKHAYEAWINDSYWLVMPYKLKDSGVTLKYQGEGQTQDGKAAQVLVLTFKGVGVTPQNKYEVWVDRQDHLVTQWAYYANAADAEPKFVGPWANWQPYGKIWLADDHGRGKHTDIAVFDELPASVFTDPAPVDLMKLGK